MDRNKMELLGKDSTIAIKIPDSLYDAFVKKINQEGLKQSDILRNYIYDYVDGYDGDDDELSHKPKKLTLNADKTYVAFRNICRQKKKTASSVLSQLIERYTEDIHYE